jgi:hypothetical protein
MPAATDPCGDPGQSVKGALAPLTMFLVVAYPRKTQEMVFDAHDRAFRLFGGTCRKGVYDNMKTAVGLAMEK